MKQVSSTLCRSHRAGQFAITIALGAALWVSNGAAVGIACAVACLVAFGIFGRR